MSQLSSEETLYRLRGWRTFYAKTEARRVVKMLDLAIAQIEQLLSRPRCNCGCHATGYTCDACCDGVSE